MKQQLLHNEDGSDDNEGEDGEEGKGQTNEPEAANLCKKKRKVHVFFFVENN